MKKTISIGLSFIILLSLSLSACGFGGNSELDESMAQTMVALAFTQTAVSQLGQDDDSVPVETEAPSEVEDVGETEAPVEVTHTMTPGEPGWVYKWFYDTDASKTAASKTVNGGDDFVANLYERPFTETEMIYRPDIDIYKTEISSDDNFFYVSIYLNDQHADGGLQGIYGVEIDTDRDGRGDLLVIADHPTATTWDIAGVSAHTDENNDVGGNSIMRPDTGYSGNGYENVVFSMDVLNDPDAAWARVNLGSPPSVTIAFKKSLLTGYGTFVWGVWAADSLLDPAMIDLHDHFTDSEAGSPYQTHSNYPLAALNLVDNTCRETYGFDATDPIPGLCYIPEEPTPEPTHRPQAEPGSVSYVVFMDRNNDGDRDAGEPLYTETPFTVSIHQGSCSSAAVQSSPGNSITFSGLPAGDYCLKITTALIMTTPKSYTFTLSEGGSIYREFGVLYLY